VTTARFTLRPALRRESFRAMGTQCAVAVTVPPGQTLRARRALAAARAEVEACERALSRFDPASDLSRLNAAAGSWVRVDERLTSALALAARARDATGGLFDPTILPALVAAGYDRSFERLEPRAPRVAMDWCAGGEIDVDPGSGRARVEAGAAVDLGGIGKGFSAERALEAMGTAWPELPGALVDLGGDIAVVGTPPEVGRWRVGVADPRNGCSLGELRLAAGGVATSGPTARRFGPDGSLHHLIDPRTGAPATGGPLSVTVVARDAATAEAHATALVMTPVEEARAYVEERPLLAALVVPAEGEPLVVGDLPLVAAMSVAA
jgi:thiamine biosynthesis lipoprotein